MARSEEDRYVDSSYRPANDPLVVAEPGTVMSDPNAWQPLSLGKQIAQNGLPIPGKVQSFLGPHWGHVTPFALSPSSTGTPIDPGPPPRLGDPVTDTAFKAAAVDVVRRSAELDPADGVQIATGPDALGDNTLGHERRPRARREPGDRQALRTADSPCAPTTGGRSPSTGPTGRSRRRRPDTGT